MTQGSADITMNDLPVFSAELHPYRSLGRNGHRIFFVIAGVLSFAHMVVFMLSGAWPVVLFFGLVEKDEATGEAWLGHTDGRTVEKPLVEEVGGEGAPGLTIRRSLGWGTDDLGGLVASVRYLVDAGRDDAWVLAHAGSDQPAHLTLAHEDIETLLRSVRITDEDGIVAPHADDRITFSIDGPGEIVATDNGDPTSLEPFPAPERRAFHGLALVIVRGKPGASGTITLHAEAEGLAAADLTLTLDSP